MESPIKAGDLVMITKTKACCGSGRIGHVFTAGERSSNPRGGQCTECGHISFDESIQVQGEKDFIAVHRLKKIDPPAQGEIKEAYRNLDRVKEAS